MKKNIRIMLIIAAAVVSACIFIFAIKYAISWYHNYRVLKEELNKKTKDDITNEINNMYNEK